MSVRERQMSVENTFGKLFLSVGAMKAGTTWLYAALKRHPALHFTPEKELHYFFQKHFDSGHLDSALRRRLAQQKYVPIFRGVKGQKMFPTSRLQRFVQNRLGRFLPEGKLDLTGLSEQDSAWIKNYLAEPVDDAWFNRLFDMTAGEIYACEFSNLSAQLPADFWADLHSRSETLKVLYTLRDPVKRLWSHTKFQLQMTQQLHLLDSWKPQDFENFARKPAIWDSAEYGRSCRALMQSLPEDALRIQSYEDMILEPKGTLTAIEEFLEVPAFKYPNWMMTRRPNKSASVRMPDFFPSLFAEDIARINGELEDLGLAIQKGWMSPD